MSTPSVPAPPPGIELQPIFPGEKFVSTIHHDTYPAIDPSTANLSGKVVAITGASRGIGQAIAVAFAQAGAAGLVLMARSATNLKSVEDACFTAARPGSDLKVLSISVDTTDYEQVAQAVQKAQAAFGRVDVLVNNAGVIEEITTMTQLDPADWRRTWEVNVGGTYNATRAFLPLLIECGGDNTIVNISSSAAHRISPATSAYQTSKIALLRFTELIVAEYGGQGVLSIAVHPGEIPTDMSTTIPKEYHFILQDTLALAAHTVVWLVNERRVWLSGRFVSALWDVDELAAKKQEIVEGDKLKMRMVI